MLQPISSTRENVSTVAPTSSYKVIPSAMEK
jgi:hypothetical protein